MAKEQPITIDGVIKEVYVENNDEVNLETPLLEFEKTQLQNDYDLAFQELKVIETELLQARQSSFQSKEDKALVSQLESKIKLAQETLNYQKILLDLSILNEVKLNINTLGNQIGVDVFSLGKDLKPEEIASLAVYLASDESDFVTGTLNLIDGGWTL